VLRSNFYLILSLRLTARAIKNLNGLVAQDQHVVVMADLYERPKGAGTQAVNLSSLYDKNSPLVECHSLAKFDAGKRSGTFDSCGWINRLVPISTTEILTSGPSNLESASLNLESAFRRYRGRRKTHPDKWATYQEISNSSE
jgi:hypothetical protein